MLEKSCSPSELGRSKNYKSFDHRILRLYVRHRQETSAHFHVDLVDICDLAFHNCAFAFHVASLCVYLGHCILDYNMGRQDVKVQTQGGD
jgi:hypothetical protein